MRRPSELDGGGKLRTFYFRFGETGWMYANPNPNLNPNPNPCVQLEKLGESKLRTFYKN